VHGSLFVVAAVSRSTFTSCSNLEGGIGNGGGCRLRGRSVLLRAHERGARRLQQAWATISPEIQSRDLVFIRKAWYATPLFYYLTPDRYSLVGRDFQRALLQHPESRIWVVLINEDQATSDMANALSDYRLVRTIRGADGQALLYQRALR